MSGIGHNVAGDRAETIRELIAESDAAHLASISKALEAGHELVAAKAECRHGEWLPFLDRAGVPERRAQRLMTLARSGLKSDTMSDLGGIKKTLEVLALLDEDDCSFLKDTAEPVSVEEINVANAPLPRSYSRAIDAARECVDNFSPRTYLAAASAISICNIKCGTWPGGKKMLATWARIASDGTLERLSKRIDEIYAARVA